MHMFFMENYSKYLEDNYGDLSKMSRHDLCEVKEIAETMKSIFEADKEYHIVLAMEEHNDLSSIEMNWDEFVHRFKQMYENADQATKDKMKSEIDLIIS